MFARRSAIAKIAAVDQAFAEAEANAKLFGSEVAGHITREYRAGNIDRSGIDAWVSLAIEQAAMKAAGVPKSMLKSILSTLHRTIRTELAAMAIDIPELSQ